MTEEDFHDLDLEIRVELFKKDLIELGRKYKLGTYSSDNYDGREEYCGTDYHFSFDDDIWFVDTIDEIFANILG